MGPTEAAIIKAALLSRHPLPKRIQEAPELEQHLVLYYNAFWDLSSCRSVGFGYGPIPWTAVTDWCILYGLDAEQIHLMHRYIRKMDEVYLKHHAKDAKKEEPKPQGGRHGSK